MKPISFTKELTMKNKLTAALHVTANYGPYVTLASSAILVGIHFLEKKNS
jgi:hypothetical protein